MARIGSWGEDFRFSWMLTGVVATSRLCMMQGYTFVPLQAGRAVGRVALGEGRGSLRLHSPNTWTGKAGMRVKVDNWSRKKTQTKFELGFIRCVCLCI
jgi:hypothetical protein